jgi:hypothetical protein
VVATPTDFIINECDGSDENYEVYGVIVQLSALLNHNHPHLLPEGVFLIATYYKKKRQSQKKIHSLLAVRAASTLRHDLVFGTMSVKS